MELVTIGEAATLSGLPPKTIRYYEEIGLLKPSARGANNYRAYDKKSIDFLRFIGRARGLGFSLPEVQELIALYRDRSRPSREVKTIALRRIQDIEHKIAELASMRDTLRQLAEKCRGDHRPECPILDRLAPRTSVAVTPGLRGTSKGGRDSGHSGVRRPFGDK